MLVYYEAKIIIISTQFYSNLFNSINIFLIHMYQVKLISQANAKLSWKTIDILFIFGLYNIKLSCYVIAYPYVCLHISVDTWLRCQIYVQEWIYIYVDPCRSSYGGLLMKTYSCTFTQRATAERNHKGIIDTTSVRDCSAGHSHTL